MTRPLLLALAAALLLAGSTAGRAATAPRVSAASVDALPKPLPLPYDEKADAKAEVAAAKARARRQGKLLLIDMGGNWCPDCRVLAGVTALPEVARFVDAHYVEVTVDVGRFTKNLDVSGHYGIARPEGVPALLVIDPKSDKLLNPGRTSALADARSMTPQALADWLAQWVR